jgi:hypothetical protein
LLSRPALLALLQRALAAGADGSAAALQLRRIELCRDEQTEALKQVSEFSANLEILREKARDAKRRAQQAGIDLRLNEGTRLPGARRGLFGPRQSPEQRAHAAQQKQMAFLAEQFAQESDAAAKALADCEAGLGAARERLKAAQQTQAGLTADMHPQLAASVLASLMQAAGGGGREAASELLSQARQVVRGDLMVGSLFVLAALFGQPDHADGVGEARRLLRELHVLFSQHQDPVERTLAALIQLVDSSQSVGRPRPSLSELGLLSAGSFSVSQHYRLYLLLLVLCGQDQGADASSTDPQFSRLLQLIAQQQAATSPAGQLPSNAPTDAPLLERVLLASTLLTSPSQHLIAAAIGVDFDSLQPSKTKPPAWPKLWDIVSALPADPWPAAELDTWRGALACLLLLGARTSVQPSLYQQWLEESYGWPKDDFYWWTLSALKADPALLRNLSGQAATQLFCFAA